MEMRKVVPSDAPVDDPSWFYYKYAFSGSIVPSGPSVGESEFAEPSMIMPFTMKYLPDWENILYVVLFFVFIIVTIVGNTLVIAAVITTTRLRSVTNCFVSSLAAADLLVGLAVMPPAVLVYINDGNWGLGDVLCVAWVSLDVLLCTASILSLCAISIDRYLAVTQPLVYSRRRRSKKLAGLMIIIVWSLAGVITSPMVLGYFPRTMDHDPRKCGYNIDPSYVVFSAVGSFFVPMFVMIYVYAKISCVIAWRPKSLLGLNPPSVYASRRGRTPLVREPERLKSFLQTQTAGPPEELSSVSDIGPGTSNEIVEEIETVPDIGPGTSKAGAVVGVLEPLPATGTGVPVEMFDKPKPVPAELTRVPREVAVSETEHQLTAPSRNQDNENNHHSSMRKIIRETKTAVTLAIVVGGFIACWLPFFILYLATPFIHSQPPTNLQVALTWLGWINSAINPFIYAFYSKDFRLAFWRLTCSYCFDANTSRPSLDTLTDGRQAAKQRSRRRRRPNE